MTKRPKKVQAVKGWAILDERGKIQVGEVGIGGDQFHIYRKKWPKEWECVPVTITYKLPKTPKK